MRVISTPIIIIIIISAGLLCYIRIRFSNVYRPKQIKHFSDELFESSDNTSTLFSATLNNPDHVLHCLLPPLKITGHDLHRPKRSHGLTSTATQSGFVRKNFIHRILYKDIY